MKFELDFFQDVPPSFTRCPIVQPVAAEDAFPPEPGIPAYIDVTIDGYDGFCDTNFNRWMLKYDQAAFPPFLPEIHVDVNVGTVRCHYSQTGGGGHLYVSDDVLVGTIAGVEYFRPVRAELISGAGFATVRVSSDTINVPAQTTHHILGVGGDCDASVQPEDVACFWATPHRLQAGHNSFVPVCSLGLTDGMIDVAAGPFPPGALDGCDEIDTFGLRVDSGHCLPCPAP
jgi:hypothetical protein